MTHPWRFAPSPPAEGNQGHSPLINRTNSQIHRGVNKNVVMNPPEVPPLFKGGHLLCAEHVRQLEGESPFHNLMEVKC